MPRAGQLLRDLWGIREDKQIEILAALLAEVDRLEGELVAHREHVAALNRVVRSYVNRDCDEHDRDQEELAALLEVPWWRRWLSFLGAS